jgi:acyl-CoA synthetase (AMP-forming)/AMP-acid ligase II
VVENLYGPTELTIACAHYRWDPEATPRESALGLVPIGKAFPHMRALVVDESLREVGPGRDGELLMAGPQVTLGYLDDPDRTAAAFVEPPGRSGTYYRTGDRVRCPHGAGDLLFLGRVDDQIKILGHRVELGEVETVVREETGIDGVVALGWPRSAGSAGGVEVFLQGEGPAEPDLAERIAGRLPSYMVPRRFHYLESFPLNASGKIDRVALAKRLERGS